MTRNSVTSEFAAFLMIIFVEVLVVKSSYRGLSV